jgi:Ni,Fe-hydrogenase III component G
MSGLSIIIAALHPVMAQILLLNTVKWTRSQRRIEAEVQRLRDVAEQMTISLSPFALALNGNFRIALLKKCPGQPYRSSLSWPVSSADEA